MMDDESFVMMDDDSFIIQATRRAYLQLRRSRSPACGSAVTAGSLAVPPRATFKLRTLAPNEGCGSAARYLAARGVTALATQRINLDLNRAIPAWVGLSRDMASEPAVTALPHAGCGSAVTAGLLAVEQSSSFIIHQDE